MVFEAVPFSCRCPTHTISSTVHCLGIIIATRAWPSKHLFILVIPLHIETGRFNNKLPEERTCPISNTGVEDECHFVCICEEYSQFREILYAKVVDIEFKVMSNEEKFVYLINYCWKTLKIYIENALDKRNGCLYK